MKHLPLSSCSSEDSSSSCSSSSSSSPSSLSDSSSCSDWEEYGHSKKMRKMMKAKHMKGHHGHMKGHHGHKNGPHHHLKRHHMRGPHHHLKGPHHHMKMHHFMKGPHHHKKGCSKFLQFPFDMPGGPSTKMVYQHTAASRAEENGKNETVSEGQGPIENVENQMEGLRIGGRDKTEEKAMKHFYKKHAKHFHKMSRLEQKSLNGQNNFENQMKLREELFYHKLESKAKKIEKKIQKLEEKKQKQILLLNLITKGLSQKDNASVQDTGTPVAENISTEEAQLQQNSNQSIPIIAVDA